jgi:replication factor C large subunit
MGEESKAGAKTLSDVVGNPSAVAQARAWAKLWCEGKRQPPLLIHGATGSGKTFLAHALAAEFGWDIYEFNASDLRNEDSVLGGLSHTSSSSSLFGGLRLVLIDDADSLSGTADRGGAGAMSKVIDESRQPIAITATDIYNKKLQSIRPKCEQLEVRRAHGSSISALLRKTALSLKIEIPSGAEMEIAKSSGGDIRAALNDLLARNFTAVRDREKSPFETVRDIFSSEKYGIARQAAFSSESDHDMLKLWVAENIPLFMKTPFEISEAYNSISRADVFDGRISRTQYYGYLRYSTDLLSSGVALSRLPGPQGFAPIAFPSYIRAMGASKGGRNMRKGVLSKIGRACHCSISQAETYLYQVRCAAKENPQDIVREFGFDEDEMEFLSSTAKSGAGLKAKAAKKKSAE